MCKAIELRDVCYRYPNSSQPSLNNLTFSVPKGAFVVVMGRSGAGKTTLSLCLNGLIPQFLEGELNGAVVIDGQDVCLHSVQSMVRHIGLVLDDPETQIFGRTVWEDAAFGPANLSLPIKDIRRRVDDALKSVHLQGYEERETAGLSGGEKQRLAIAGVLALQPEILALDEPTSELDPVGRTEIYHTIDTLRSAKQLTIFVTEQNSEEIICRADELLVLDRGVIAWQGIPQEFFRNIPLVTEFGIRPLSVGLVGWDFYQKGWIAFKEIPLDVAAAGKLIGSVLIKRNLIDRINGRTAQPGLPPAAKAPVLIRVNNLNYRYTPDRIALQSVNLTIRAGEFVALIGKNGSGKTTLAKHFNGLLKPSNGEVLIDGMNTKDVGTAALARVVGYVFQNPDHQIFSDSVVKELEYGLVNTGLDTIEMQRRIDRVLRFTGLEQYRSEPPLSLGKGVRQMIAVASILVLEPHILVIDEPTTGLDWDGIQQIMSLIGQLHKNGTTIIMITQDMEIVAQYADRVIVMNKGRVAAEGGTKEVLENFPVLAQAGIVPPQILRLSAGLKAFGLRAAFLHAREFIAAIDQALGDT